MLFSFLNFQQVLYSYLGSGCHHSYSAFHSSGSPRTQVCLFQKQTCPTLTSQLISLDLEHTTAGQN